jgi:hypothetical protein
MRRARISSASMVIRSSAVSVGPAVLEHARRLPQALERALVGLRHALHSRGTPPAPPG